MSFSFYDILRENNKSSESPDSRYGSYGIILNEAPEDDNSGAESSGGGDDFSIDADTDSGNDNNQDDSGDDLDMGSLDDNIDTSDDGSSSDSNNSGSDSASSSDNSNRDEEDKPVEANTDIFSSLTAEEQAIKIKELKKLFGNLYNGVDELLDRLNELEISETNKYVISKISADLCDIKTTIADYILYIFNTKSYIENDIAFNRFLSDINYITSILEKLQKIEEKEELS